MSGWETLRPARLGGLTILAAVIFWSLGAAPMAAQTPTYIAHEVFAGSGLEQYLRLLQLMPDRAVYPWSIRGFTVQEVEKLGTSQADHPWEGRFRFVEEGEGASAGDIRLLQPRSAIHFNSGFPYGRNDGPVWVGKGITGVVQAGIAARGGPFSVVVAPIAFRAENRPFELAPTGFTGNLTFADPRFPREIDRPQRFGDRAYQRIDPGESRVTLALGGVAAGVGTASQHWGPAREHPILIGNNAGGYPHAFVGTSAPLDLRIARLHGRMVWGRLEQSAFTDIPAEESRRLASGLVLVVLPRWPEGLELGFGRFYHILWRDGGPSASELLRPLEAFFKSSRGPQQGGSDEFSSPDNQLASVFARWALPAAGFELYGEYGRNDHNWDLRDFFLQPDHDSSYLLGFQKVWAHGRRFAVARGELLNARVSHLSRVRTQVPFYRHHERRQGHTHRGQVLGSSAGLGGTASVLAADLYHPGGRWTLAWERAVRRERGRNAGAITDDPRAIDVTHALGAEWLFFRGRFEIDTGLHAVFNLNRDFVRDAFNLNATLGVRLAVP